MHDNTPLDKFINVIFGNDFSDETVCLAQPATVGFRHYPATERKIAQIERKPGSWYVCVSTVKPAEKLRRRKQDCVTAYAVMLDDIGTKVPADTIPVSPNIAIETSEGNFQYIYLIEPFDVSTDEGVAYYEACLRGLGEAGLCDKGALEVNRVFRVPGSINTKEGKNNFQARVVYHNVDSEWALDKLMDAFVCKPVYKNEGVKGLAYEGEIPDDVNDPVLDWLQEIGRVRSDDGEFFKIRCPWAHEHTSGEDSAGYSPLGVGAGALAITRGFHCFHEHCAHRTSRDFLAWVAEQEGPSVRVSGVSELTVRYLKEKTRELTANEKFSLLIGSVPELHPANMPDIKFTAKGVLKPNQPCTRENIQHCAETLGVDMRMNLQTRKPELRFFDESVQTMVVGVNDAEQVLRDRMVMAGVTVGDEFQRTQDNMCFNNPYHPFEEWLDTLKWDGSDHLSAVTASVTVAPQYGDMWPIYLRKWLIQCVQAGRGWRNPQMMRNVLVLQGEQDLGKTTWLGKLFGPGFFKEGAHLALQGPMAKDCIMAATKNVAVELGELDSTFSKSESGALKAFLSLITDSYRAPYGKKVEDWPRSTSFCASVNELDFLIDSTGSSRFWPVEVRRIDWGFRVNIEQLWAQVDTLHREGGMWDLAPQEKQVRKAQAEHFTVTSDAAELLHAYLDNHTSDNGQVVAMNATMIARDLLNVTANVKNRRDIKKVLDVRIGYRKDRLDGVRKGWHIPVGVKAMKTPDLKSVK